jgi:23S rRNA pseudouridine1911/1915/1917 synthase
MQTPKMHWKATPVEPLTLARAPGGGYTGPMRTSPSPDAWTVHRVSPDEAGQALGAILRGPMGISGRRIQKLTRSRGLRINGRPAHTSRRVAEGDRVEVRTLDAPSRAVSPGAEPPPAPGHGLDHGGVVPLLEDPHVLVLDKPPGVVVHPTGTIKQGTLVQRLALRDQARGIRAGIHAVHRLDRDTSGVLLVARTPAAHARLDQELRGGRIHRRYLAVVAGHPEVPGGLIDLPLVRESGGGSRRVVQEGGAPARTRVEVLERMSSATLLAVTLDTGRTHQIRAHLSHLGHPLLGDQLYGGATGPSVGRMALHAHALVFPHPASGEEITVEAPLPPDLLALLDRLRLG